MSSTPPESPNESPNGEREQILNEVLEDQATRKAARVAAAQARLDRPEQSFYMQVGLLVMGTFFFYLLFFSPSWVAPTAAQEIGEEQYLDGARFSVFLLAQRVEAFRNEYGRLPADNAELGHHETDVVYERVSRDSYELRTTSSENVVRYLSTEPLDDFAITAEQLLEGRS